MKKLKIVLILLIAILATVIIALFLFKNDEVKPPVKPIDNVNNNSDNDIVEEYSPLDGSPITESEKDQPVIGVILDNQIDAQPQSGLNEASIVYEFRVEGDITRYLALFYNSDAEQIGPVRSARPYLVQTISEYDGVLAHFGGSELGLSTIRNLAVYSLNGIELDGITYYRNYNVNKVAPHNAYTSVSLLEEAINNKSYINKRDFEGFDFDLKGDIFSSQMKNGADAKNINILSTPAYTLDFKYDKSSKSYNIFRNNEQMIDEYDDKSVQAKNIIIEFANSRIIGNDGTLEISHIGSGSGKLISEGKIININWQKDSANSKTIFMTENGEKINLKPGQTWIEILEEDTNITIE